MEYKGFDFKPGNVYNFQSADGLAQVSPAQPDAAPTEAASYATSAGDLAYQKFSEWLTRALDELGFSPDLSPFLLETLHNQGDIYTLLCDLCSADGIDISIIREMADEINAQYVLVHTAYGSSEGRDEKGDTASDVDCGIDGSADPEADVCDDEETEGFNFIEKAIELEEYLETRYGATGQSTAFSADSIWQALCLCSGEVEHSCQLLESVLQALNECRPCRHLLQGGCFRSDCRFNHDLSSVPCRYWLLSASGCTLEQCPFSHNIEVVVSTISADTNSNGTTTFSGIIEDSHFPQLGATASDVSSKSLSYARKVAGSAVSYKDAASSKQCVQSSTSNPSLYQMKIGAPTSGKMVCKDETFGISDWVTSGSAVGHVYEMLRAEAKLNAAARNRLFEEATRAYMSGQRDVAKALSLRGKEANNLMKQCHLQASKEIFRSRNSMQNLSKGQIDIHGLHVAEMISCMEEMINYFGSGPRRNSPLRVITGSGHHTEGPQRGEAKLLPALVQYCIELQINHSYILDPKGIKCGLILKFL